MNISQRKKTSDFFLTMGTVKLHQLQKIIQAPQSFFHNFCIWVTATLSDHTSTVQATQSFWKVRMETAFDGISTGNLPKKIAKDVWPAIMISDLTKIHPRLQ